MTIFGHFLANPFSIFHKTEAILIQNDINEPFNLIEGPLISKANHAWSPQFSQKTNEMTEDSIEE